MKLTLFLVLKAFWIPFGTTAFLMSSPHPVTATTMHAAPPLAQFAPEAAKLFGNMITPASIMGGAIVPIGFAAGLDFHGAKGESKFAKVLRRIFPFVCVGGFTSQLLAVMWASVTVNQLTENKPALAESVWHLLQRDYAIQWAAVNSHFVMGLLMFLWIIATKAYFIGGQGPVGMSAFLLALSAMSMAISVVNRGVAAGGGVPGLQFGSSIIGLLQTYVKLFVRRSAKSVNPLEWLACGLCLASIYNMARSMVTLIKHDKKE